MTQTRGATPHKDSRIRDPAGRVNELELGSGHFQPDISGQSLSLPASAARTGVPAYFTRLYLRFFPASLFMYFDGGRPPIRRRSDCPLQGVPIGEECPPARCFNTFALFRRLRAAAPACSMAAGRCQMDSKRHERPHTWISCPVLSPQIFLRATPIRVFTLSLGLALLSNVLFETLRPILTLGSFVDIVAGIS